MTTAQDKLRAIAGLPDEQVDLTDSVLELSRLLSPGLSCAHYRARLESLAETARLRIQELSSPAEIIEALNDYLFRELGFTGNRDDFYDPRNSFLDAVLERRLGIPISLSVLYMEIARRIGLKASGVSFPGHFLVKIQDDDGYRILDVFEDGRRLTEKELDRRLSQLYGEKAPRVSTSPSLLRSAANREILVRMLRNLKGVYLKREDYPQALAVIDAILIFTPDSPEEYRDRGLIYGQLEYAPAAVADLRRYLDMAPDAEDARDLLSLIDDLDGQDIRTH